MEGFTLRGKVVRMARVIKGVNQKQFAEIVGVDSDYIAKMEKEFRSISRRNEIKILRGLRKELGVTDAQLACLQLILEEDEGKFDE